MFVVLSLYAPHLMGDTPPPPAAAAGWYPDPSGPPGQQRYWDGRQWTAVQPPPPPPKSAAGPPKGGKVVLGVIAAIAVFAAIAAIVEKTGDSEETASTSTSSATARPTVSTTAAAAAPTPQPVDPVPCQPAPPNIVEIINASFADGASQLRNAQAVELPQAMTYIGADIYQGDERVSSQDRWLVSGGAVFAISPDARRRTLLPDGRDLLPMDDYDERQSLDACVLQESRG